MLNAEFIRLAHRFVKSEDAQRPEITGVLIEPYLGGGAIITATNGLVIGVFWDPLGYTPVPRCVRIEDDNGWGNFGPQDIVTFDGPLAEVKTAGVVTYSCEYENLDAFKYPDWRALEVIPKSAGERMANGASFDLTVLEPFRLNKDENALAIWATDDGERMDTHLVTHKDYPTFVGAASPIACDEDHMFVRPSWLD